MSGFFRYSDSDILEINEMLDWRAGTLLPDGRLLGKLEVKAGKRTTPGLIPDKRIVKLNEELDLSNKSILEIGCFEGIHTLGLRMFSDSVTAVDVRPVNVVKTLARLAYHGSNASVYQMDVENSPKNFKNYDVIFHCGVLYHLSDPAEHILSLKGKCTHLFLDTHVTRKDMSIENREVAGLQYSGAFQKEGGWSDPFSGKDTSAFWLTFKSLEEILRFAGFNKINVWETRDERNEPRVALVASV